MLRGFVLVSYWADDLEAAKEWYSEFLGIEPYFERPGYYEFRLGDYQHELGLIDSRYAPASSASGPGGAVLYWHVDEVAATLRKLLSMESERVRGAHAPRGGGVRHRFGGRSLRERPGHHVQPALPGGPGRDQKSVTSAPGDIGY